MAKKIMVVDDEEHLVELVKAVLENAGFSVITAASGQACLEVLKKSKPDLVLMDMMMPNMSGRETIERIRQNAKTKNLKVAFLTVAKFSEIGKEQLKKLKVSDYITKPFEIDDLVNRVKKIVG